MGNRIKALIIFLIFIISPSAYALEHPSFFKGYTQMNEGRYDEAIMYFNISVKADPDYLPAYSHLALCYERKEDFPKAIEAWQKYTEFDSYFKREVQAHIELTDKFLKAREYLKQSQMNEVLPLLEEIVALDKYPMSVLWLYAAKDLGEVYFNNKTYDRVIGLYEKINLYYPKDLTEEILFRYAYSYQQGREFEKALDIYKKLDKTFSIKDKEKVKKYKNFVSLCYEGIGDEAFVQEEYKKAMDSYDIAIKGFSAAENIPRVNQKRQKAEGNLAFYYKTEGDTYAEMEEYSKAVEFYEKIMEECSNSEKYSEAKEKRAQLINLEREYKSKAFEYYSQNKYVESLKLCELLLKQFPEGEYAPWAQKQIGEIYAAQEDYHRAINELLKVAKNYPDSYYADDALERAGVYFWCILNQKDKALKIFRYIVKKYPKENYADRALYYIGVIHLQEKRYLDGYRALKMLLNQYPDSDLKSRTEFQIKKLMEVAKKAEQK